MTKTVRILVVGRARLDRQLAAMRARVMELGRMDIVVESVSDFSSRDDVHAVVALPMAAAGEAQMAALPALRIICTPSVGTDHIDIAAAKRRGITVSNAPGFNTVEVAEHTITLAAMLLRDVWPSAHSARARGWSEDRPLPHRLSGSRLGLVGFGAIGRRTAGLARALGMEVSVWSRSLPPGEDHGGVIAVASLSDLLARQDVISLHLPLAAETRHLMNDAAFAAVRPGTKLVNTARGGLIDADALLRALDDGRIAAAALDVLEQEPPDPADPLLIHPRVVVTPHSAWLSPVSAVAAYRLAVDAVHAAMPTERQLAGR